MHIGALVNFLLILNEISLKISPSSLTKKEKIVSQIIN